MIAGRSGTVVPCRKRAHTPIPGEERGHQVAKNQSSRERGIARAYFWFWVILATLLSVAGNTVHAAWSADQLDTPWLRVAVGAVPPVMLAMGAEGVSQLYRVGGHAVPLVSGEKRPWIWWCAVLGVAGLALAAFALSYSALAAVASMVHYPPTLSAVYPLVLDLSIAVGLLALVALPPVRHDEIDDPSSAAKPAVKALDLAPAATRPAPAVPGHTPPAVPAAAAPERIAPPSGTRTPALNLTRPTSAVRPESAGAPDAPRTPSPAQPTDPASTSASTLADQLIAAGVTRKDREVVVKILTEHQNGANVNSAATAADVSHHAARRIIEGAQQLVSVGPSSSVGD